MKSCMERVYLVFWYLSFEFSVQLWCDSILCYSFLSHSYCSIPLFTYRNTDLFILGAPCALAMENVCFRTKIVYYFLFAVTIDTKHSNSCTIEGYRKIMSGHSMFCALKCSKISNEIVQFIFDEISGDLSIVCFSIS